MAGLNINDMPNTALLQLAAICAILEKNNIVVSEMVKTGEFPAPHAVNNGIPVWLVGDVKGWLATRPVNQSV